MLFLTGNSAIAPTTDQADTIRYNMSTSINLTMPLLSLPHEILLLITQQLDLCRDLLRVICLNRFCYNLFISDLYKRDVASTGGFVLIWQADRGFETGVREMIAAGANVDLQHPLLQRTPLLMAIRQSHAHVVKILLENGATPDLMDSMSNSPLSLSISSGLCDGLAIPKMLLDYGADVNLRGRRHEHSPLFIAVKFCESSVIQLLIDRGADVHFREAETEMTMLHAAAEKARPLEIVKVLVEAGVDADSRESSGMTPLMVAASKGATSTVQALLDCGADIHLSTPEGRIALHFAANSEERHTAETVRLLMDRGVDPNVRDAQQCTPLHVTREEEGESLKRAKLLLDYGADLQARDIEGKTVLHHFSKRRHLELVKWAYERGVDVNCTDHNGGTPLLSSVKPPSIRDREAPETTQTLIELEADVNMVNSQLISPLCFAAGTGCFESASALVQHGANVHHKDENGCTPLHWSTGGPERLRPLYRIDGALKTIQLLLDRGAEVNVRNLAGETPLGMGLQVEYTRVQDRLQEAGGVG